MPSSPRPRARRRIRTWLSVAVACLLAAPTVALTSPAAVAHPGHDAAEGFKVLVFSKTAGFRHDSIEPGVAAIEELGAEHGFEVDATEDAGAFTEENLAGYEAVVWLSTTGDVLDEAQQAAFQAYVEGGGGYAGVHAASDTEYEWEWYGDLVGAYFDNHPPGTAEADVQVADAHHPSTANLPARWTRTDEWYSFRENPRGQVHVLATLDEKSYEGGTMGADHPIAWCQDKKEGRSWYTGGGHTAESFADPQFREHLLGGIRTAAGAVDADCGATVDSSFEQVTLAKGADKTGEPIAMAVLPDGDVLHTSRDGSVRLTTSTATTTLAGRVPVYNHDEDGLQGVAIDPDFAQNRWVYLYYAPPLDTPAGDAPETGTAEDFEPFRGHNQLSRYRLGEDGTLDLGSEQQILQVPTDRGTCCHAGGEIDFDGDGNLLLSTGDDTNPFASDGYTPLDQRPERNPAWDAARSSGNTNDLRGKLLRIRVGEDGTYTAPEGNLFAESEDSDDKTRPEIYAMGFRNPFRFSVDRRTGWIHLGDYGPDAGAADPERGPAGTVEFNVIKEPGNYGWPYCVGDNQPFVDHDFATGESGEPFDCAKPVNDSPNNTGLTELPPVVPAWLPYDGGSVPELGTGGESPMGAVVYDYDAELESETKWPEYYDGKALMYEWDRAWIKEARLGEDGALQSISPTLDWMDLRRPMNIEFGPDGSLYVLDYGGGYFGGDAQSAVYRIDYVKGSRSPQADIRTSATSGAVPLEVDFDGSGSTHPEGLDVEYAWDFDGDGETDSTEPTGSFTYTEPGQYTARLTLTDTEGREGFATATITAGNTAPTVELEIPEDGSFFGFGDEVPFRVKVTDPEDGSALDCSKVNVEYILGHDNHGHPLSRETGCEGTITTVADEGHGLDADIFGVINASYTDGGAEGVPALTSDDEALLHTRTKQAEYADELEGLDVLDKDGAVGGRQLGNIEPGDWFAWDPMVATNLTGVSARYASGGSGGQLEVRVGAPDGPVAATIEMPATGGWDQHRQSDVAEIADVDGDADGEGGALYFVATGPDESVATFDVDQLVFSGKGAAGNAAPEIRAMTVTPDSGPAPLEVQATAEAVDPDGGDLSYAWDFDGDGEADGTEPEATHTYTEGGTQQVSLTVTDDQGATATATRDVVVDAEQPCEPAAPAEGYRSLFDGTAESLAAWRMAGPGEMALRDDCTMETTGGMGLLWHPDELEDYSLTLDWKMQGDDNSGVFVGFPDPGDDPWVAVNEGYEVQIDATDEPDRTTGAVYTFQGADAAAVEKALNPPGEWNSYEIRKVGQTITVVLNGVTVNEFTSTERDIARGHVGLQNHGPDDTVWFRDVQVKDLGDEEPADPQSTVTTASAPEQSRYGSPARVRVQVDGADRVPAGEVVVEADGTEAARGELDAQGRATLTVEGLAPGNRVLRVRYLGQPEVLAGSETRLRHRVLRARSETSVRVGPGRITPATSPTVTARVAAPVDVGGYATVTVRRAAGGAAVVTRRTRVVDGQAAWTLPPLGAGRWRVEVTYAGSGTVEDSRAATTVQVVR